MFHLVLIIWLCWLLAIPASAFSQLSQKNRVGDFSERASFFAFGQPSQRVETHQENLGVGYDYVSGVHKYLYGHADPINTIDPSGHGEGYLASLMVTVGSIATMASQQLSAIVQRTGPMFQVGGRQLGLALQEFGALAQNTAYQVIRIVQTSTANLRIVENIQRGSRFIDFSLQYGQRLMDLEIKYKLPSRAGEALTRLVSQAQASVAAGEAQTVIWTLKEPTLREVQLVTTELGAAASKVQFVHGVDGLLQYIAVCFGL